MDKKQKNYLSDMLNDILHYHLRFNVIDKITIKIDNDNKLTINIRFWLTKIKEIKHVINISLISLNYLTLYQHLMLFKDNTIELEKFARFDYNILTLIIDNLNEYKRNNKDN